MQDVALKHKEIIGKLSRYENGVVVETMNKMGLKYPVNYGLSIPQINKIADSIAPDDQLAQYLWQQKERESKLLSLRLLNADFFDEKQLENIINGISNIELAEQAGMSLFPRLKNRFEIVGALIEHQNNFVKLSGYALFSRLIHEQESIDTYISIFKNILTHLPSENTIYINRGLASALLKLGLRDNSLKTMVLEGINSLTSTRKELHDYLVQEVNNYLLITN